MEAMISGLRCNSRHGSLLQPPLMCLRLLLLFVESVLALVVKKYSYRSDMPAIQDMETEKISQVIGDWCMSCMAF